MTDPAAPGPAPAASLAYDDAFAELQRTVALLEAGGQPLETTLELYERAVALQRRCETLLAAAELRIQQLLLTRDGPVVRDVAPAGEVPEAADAGVPDDVEDLPF